jgi:hypothetical protein
MLKKIDDLEARFKTGDETAVKYQSWQQVLDQVPHNFAHLEEARE